MKRYFVTFIVITMLSGVSTSAQTKGFFGWLHVAPKAGAGASLFLNSNILQDNNIQSKALNFGHQYGGQVGISFVDLFELNYEYTFLGVNQLYTIQQDNFEYEKSFLNNYTDQAVLLRFWGSTSYFEVGMSQTDLTDVTIENNVLQNNTGANLNFVENTAYFSDSYKNILVGFGFAPFQYDVFEIDLGLRFRYSLDPIHENTSEYPIPFNDQVYINTYNDVAPTKNLTAYFQIELKYFFGFYGKAMCGSRSLMLFKKPKKFQFYN